MAAVVIDAYSHVCPKALLDAIEAVKPSAESGGVRQNFYLHDCARRLDYMDRVGVDMQALVLVRPPMWLGMDRTDIHRLTRVANETIGKMAAEHPDRFIAVGVLPVVDEVTMADFTRMWRDLDLKGVLIFSNIEGRPIDEPPMWALYEKAAEWDLPIWIHPQHAHSYPWITQNLLDRLFGWPYDTTLAMARLVYAGVFERFPTLKIITHHLGGMVPYYAERIRGFYDEVQAYASAGIVQKQLVPLSGSVIDHFKRFYNDSNVSGWDSGLQCGLDFFGAEHILFGTDFPMGPDHGEAWPEDIMRSIREYRGISDAQRALILGENAVRLLGLDDRVRSRKPA